MTFEKNKKIIYISPNGRPFDFVCRKCDTVGEITFSGYKKIERLNPRSFGVVTYQKEVYRFKCKKCNSIIEDYFN